MDFPHTRRMTRAPNAFFSKKMKNHARAMALHLPYCNFARIHKTLEAAVADGVTERLWEVGGYGRRAEAWESPD